LAHFHLAEDPMPGKDSAKLIHLINPKTLPKGFPYPTPSSSELRKRPSYYYTQSSVIPYRMNDGVLEILITRSSQKKHWVVPKGIADPGHSLRESAAKEALEEAGVEGEVANEAVGEYQYEKWGATCTVTVYPMAVTRVLEENEWEEKHRGRQWLTASQAATTVRQPEVGHMIELLEQQLCPA
jgi:phosphohistidine phosphatase